MKPLAAIIAMIFVAAPARAQSVTSLTDDKHRITVSGSLSAEIRQIELFVTKDGGIGIPWPSLGKGTVIEISAEWIKAHRDQLAGGKDFKP